MPPTGQRKGCPACRTVLAGLYSKAIAEEQCPRCEADLWALALPSGPVFFVRLPGQSAAVFVESLVRPRLNPTDTDIASSLQGADSLALVELIAEIETAWERRDGWPDDPMYDPQLDEQSLRMSNGRVVRGKLVKLAIVAIIIGAMTCCLLPIV